MIDPRHIWNVIYNARSNIGYHATSPNTAPATKSDSHDWSASHMKRHLQCAEQERLPSNITKYCACHEKWLSWLIRVTYETLFAMRGATEVTLQHHQILRLPRKILKLRRNFSKTAETSFTMRDRSDHDPRMIRAWNHQSATGLATEVTCRARHEHFLLRNKAFRAPAIIPNFTKCCTCHEEWHCNFTKYCASHANWLSGLIRVTYETSCTMRGATKVTLQHHQIPAPATQTDSHDWSASHMKPYLQCAEQQRLPSNITKYCACHAKF